MKNAVILSVILIIISSFSVFGVVCGNGITESPEQCDDGGNAEDDGCDADCNIEVNWICSGTPSVCDTKIICGNGVLDAFSGEGCDDGDTNYGDGCGFSCQPEAGWNCLNQPSVCKTTCGDAMKVGPEQCDDGNIVNGDGCSSMCQTEQQVQCIDSDGGLDSSVQGKVTYGSPSQQLEDTCEGTDYVQEWFCNPTINNLPDDQSLNCPSGTTCQNGACQTEQQVQCIDSDSGLDSSVKGTVTYSNQQFEDVCEGTDFVQEWFCNPTINNLPDDQSLNCPPGTTCQAGACQAGQQQTLTEEICQAADGIEDINDLGLLQGVIDAIKNNPGNKIDAVLDVFTALNAWFAAQ